MVEPITMAIMAGGKALGSGLNFIQEQKQRAINEALVEAQVQALEDKITVTKIQAAQAVANIQGSGVVSAGSRGTQFSGSIATATAQGVRDTEFKKMVSIQELKYQQRVAELVGSGKDAQLSSSQIGGIISGATSGAEAINTEIGNQNTQDKLDLILGGKGNT